MDKRKRRSFYALLILLFLLYLAGLVYVLLFAEAFRRVTQSEEVRYNLILFKEIIRIYNGRESIGFWLTFANLAGNVLGFVPLGFFLPALFPGMRHGMTTVSACFGFSFLFEMIQLLTKIGCFDVDDLFLNTVGAVLGYLIYVILHAIYRALRKKHEVFTAQSK